MTRVAMGAGAARATRNPVEKAVGKWGGATLAALGAVAVSNAPAVASDPFELDNLQNGAGIANQARLYPASGSGEPCGFTGGFCGPVVPMSSDVMSVTFQSAKVGVGGEYGYVNMHPEFSALTVNFRVALCDGNGGIEVLQQPVLVVAPGGYSYRQLPGGPGSLGYEYWEVSADLGSEFVNIPTKGKCPVLLFQFGHLVADGTRSAGILEGQVGENGIAYTVDAGAEPTPSPIPMSVTGTCATNIPSALIRMSNVGDQCQVSVEQDGWAGELQFSPDLKPESWQKVVDIPADLTPGARLIVSSGIAQGKKTGFYRVLR